jgi:hypothetical protein
MTFDAGSIEATLDLDRTPFQRGLAAAKREAADFARQRITARLDLDADTTKARRQIEAMRRSLDRKTKLDVDADIGSAEAKLTALRAQLRGLHGDVTSATEAEQANFHAILDSIAILGPALVPLASGLGGLSSSAISFGGVLTLAVKGASAAMEEGNRVGQQYTGTLGILKDDVNQLEATAAKGVLKPFIDETNTLNRQVPQLNSLVARLSPVVGDALGHGANGLVGLLTSAEPLIEDATDAVDGLFAKFDNWANSGGGQSFFNALDHDIPIAVDTIGNLGTTVGHLLSAMEGPGTAVLQIIDDISEGISHIPVPILTAGVGALVTWRAAALASAAATALATRAGAANAAASSEEAAALDAVAAAAAEATAAINALAAANTRNAVASAAGMRIAGGAAAARAGAAGAGAAGATEGELAGAAAGGGLLARSAGLLSRIAPWAIAGYFGGSILKSSTSGMATSENRGERAAKAGLDVVGDFLTGHWGFGSVRADLAANDRINSRQELQAYVTSLIKQAYAPGGAGVTGTLVPYRTPQNIGADAVYAQSAGARYAAGQEQLNRAGAGQVGRLTDPTAIADANDTVTASIQKRIEAEQKLFDSSKNGITLTKGLSVSEKAYSDEMAKTGNNIVATTNYFRGHQEALDSDKVTLQQLQDRQATYNRLLADVAGKYNINATAAGTYLTALGLTYDKVTLNNQTEQKAVQILGEVNDKFANGPASMQAWLSTISQIDLSTDTLSQRVTILGAGLQAIQGDTNNLAGANLSAVTSIEDVANKIEANSASVGRNGKLLGQLTKTTHGYVVEQPKLSAGALQVQQSMAQAGSTAIQLAQAIYQNTGNAKQAFDAYKGLRDQFISTEIQAGRSRKAAKALADQIYGVPKDASTFVHLLNKDNVAHAISELTQALIGPHGLNNTIATAIAKLDDTQFQTDYGTILDQLTTLNNTTVHPTISTRTVGGVDVGPLTDKPKADGGLITVGTGPRADDVLIRASKGEFVVNAVQTAKNRPLLEAINSGTHGFAGGGYVPPSLITSGGSGGSGDGSGGGSSSKNDTAANKAKEAAKKALDALLSELSGDISAINGLLPPANATRAAINQLDASFAKLARQGDITRKAARHWEHLGTVVENESARISKISAQITKDKALLDNVTSERTSVRSGVLGLFDPGTSGNGYRPGILESLTQANTSASKFDTLQAQAEKLGLNKTLLQQIVSEGPETAGKNLQAIVSGGRSYVRQLDAQYARLVGTANRIADRQTTADYGTTQAKLTEKIRAESTKQTEIQRQMNAHLKALRTELSSLRRELKNGKRTK